MLIFFKINLFFNTICFPNKKYSFETENEFMFRSHGMGYFDHFKTFSFPSPLPKNTFQSGDWSKWKIVSGLTEIRFFQINSYQKTQWGWSRWWEWNGTVCFGGVLYETLSKIDYSSSSLHLTGTRSPEDATCLPNARHVARWQCCPTSSPYTVTLPWAALFPLHKLKPKSMYFSTNVTD